MNDLKRRVVLEVIKAIELMLATAREGSKEAAEESRSHKGAMESRYDTFKEEAQYLMAGQDKRIVEFNSTITSLRALLSRIQVRSSKVGVFSLVELEDDTKTRALYLVLSSGGGVTCVVDDKKVTTINVSSPVAQALLGLEEGESADSSCDHVYIAMSLDMSPPLKSTSTIHFPPHFSLSFCSSSY